MHCCTKLSNRKLGVQMEFLEQSYKTIFNFQHHHKLLFLQALVEIVIL